jgi:hypothetical protein
MLAHGFAGTTGQGPRAPLARLGLGVGAGLAALSALTAVAVLGLCLSDPLRVADAVGTGDLTAIFRIVSAFVVSVVKETIRYL